MSVEALGQQLNNTTLEDVDVRCVVCFHINLDPYKFLGCKHNLCAGCSGRWLTAGPCCVLCRQKVEEIEIDEELKAKAERYLQLHPEQATPPDIMYEHYAYETIFWSIQHRKPANDPDLVFYGPKPTNINENYSEEEKTNMIENIRLFKIRERLEILKERIGRQAPLVQKQYNQQMFEKFFYDNDAIYRDDEQEWRMVHGRGLVRVPRSTNRNYCPIRFRRSHST